MAQLTPGATIKVELPTLHADQVNIFRLREDARGGEWAANAGGRYKAVRCGRRYGKSVYGETWIADGAVKGHPCGWFAPSYKLVSEVYQDLKTMLEPVIAQSSKTDGVIRLITGGRIDFWTLENEDAGRSRMYKRVFIDEGAFTKSGPAEQPGSMMSTWEKAIKPTLLDLTGRAIVASNTNGNDPDNFLYAICNEPKHGFIEYHAPSWSNPTIPRRRRAEGFGHNGGPPIWLETLEEWQLRQDAEYANLRAREHPLVFAQEYGADFIDWGGVAFFDIDRLLNNGEPLPYPAVCDMVYAVVDTATKTGSENDSTAVTWFARTRFGGVPLLVLDWDLVQIEGATLEAWLPVVLQHGEYLAKMCGARAGFVGAWIEDKDSGQILLQQALKKRLKVRPIDSPLTALGKDGRAISVSGYVYRGEVKYSDVAYNKTKEHKGSTRNHLVAQVSGFKVGDKENARRADDALDTFTYGVALGLGDSKGF